MKKTITILSFLISSIGFSQSNESFPFYEQKAFDFYKTKILGSFPVKKRIKIFKYTIDIHPPYFWFHTPTCLKGIVWKNNDQFKEIDSYTKTQMYPNSTRFELDLSNLNKKQFKVKENSNASFPKLYITEPHFENHNQERIFINIHQENSEYESIIYHIEFDNIGNVIDWCKTETHTIIVI